jgi:predicted HTH transcriptional regulator
MKTEFKTISKKARFLLDNQESLDVDFKRSLSGLEASDLVAFANSENGGTILIGIDEGETTNGRQKGIIVGCPITDAERLKIINKAESCVPPVDLDIIVENSAAKPFFRIEIPSGKIKPYCTSKGVYTIRGDGRNRPLLPDKLLRVFLDIEGDEFYNRFRQATEELEGDISAIKLGQKNNNHNNDAVASQFMLTLSNEVLAAIRAMDRRVDNLEQAIVDIVNKLNRITD